MRMGSAEIAGILRRQIGAGELAARERLPAERHLAERYGVARGTVPSSMSLSFKFPLSAWRASSNSENLRCRHER